VTEKELMYIEDVLEHEKDLQNICEYYANEVSNQETKDFLISLLNFQEQNYEKLYGLLSK
jgi:cAMP phosphodiesterase